MHTAVDNTASDRAEWIDALYRGQPLLAAIGILLLLTMIPSLAALALDGRTVNGISVWMKPLKFQASAAILLLTGAWLLLWLPEEHRRTALVRAMAVLMAGAAFFEIAYIGHQASLGQGSHFNIATPYNRFMYGMMALGSLILVGTAAGFGVLILRHGDRREVMVLAAGLGLILGSILGLITGVSLSLHNGHRVGGDPSDTGGLPIFGWSRTGGDLRVAHFVGLHMMQSLPIAALLVRGFVNTERQRYAILAVAALGTIATVAAYLQAWMGLPLLPA